MIASAARRRPSFAAQALRIARKDLAIEWRSRELVTTMTFFAVVVVLVFAMAFAAGDERPGPAVTAGILWVALALAGTVGLARTFDRERDGGAMRALLLSPVPRAAIYVGKLGATTLVMLVVQTVVVLLAALLFGGPFAAHPGLLAGLLALGTVGFASVGTVFSAALARSTSRDVLLGSLLYPVAMPVLLAGARATAQLLDPAAPDLGGPILWTQFLVAVDVLFVVTGLWAFEPIATAE